MIFPAPLLHANTIRHPFICYPPIFGFFEALLAPSIEKGIYLCDHQLE